MAVSLTRTLSSMAPLLVQTLAFQETLFPIDPIAGIFPDAHSIFV
jgi:hypothetical protein